MAIVLLQVHVSETLALWVHDADSLHNPDFMFSEIRPR